jgi:HK97 family phage portal protein
MSRHLASPQASSLEDYMPTFSFPWFQKQVTDTDISATVPLVTDLSSIQYPEDNYKNFSRQGYARNEIVYACIRELSQGVGSARYYVGKSDPDGGIITDETSPVAQLLERPNDNQDWHMFLADLVTFLQVSGNVYVLKERARNNQVTSMWLLRPDRVAIQPSERGVHKYTYEIDGDEYELDPNDIGHMSLPNPSGDVYGLSPLHILAKTVNLDMSMTDFAKAYFMNAGVPSGLLKVKRRLNNQAEATRIRARWRSSFGGARNAHSVAILDDDAEYQAMADAPEKMALRELHDLTESRICAVFGVPPILISANVGLQRSTFSNYREARFSFHSETLEPLINDIVRFLNHCFSYEFNDGAKIMADFTDMRSFLDDKDTVTTRATALFQAGIITLNEARSLVGQDGVDDGDIRRVPMNIIESESIEKDQLALSGSATKSLEEKASRIAPGAVTLRRNLLEQREDLADKMYSRMQTYLKRIKNRADGVLGRYLARTSEEQKNFPFNWQSLIPDEEQGELANALRRSYVEIVKNTFSEVNDSNVAGVLQFSEKIPEVQRILTQSNTRANLIHSTTQKRIQDVLTIASERGYSIEQVANGVPADKFKGVREALGETQIRARLIARTEVMRTQNLSSLAHFKTQGFEYMRADDVDGDPNDNFVPAGDPYGRTCAERNGQIYHVDDAVNIDDHPNGTLNWSPMPRNYQPDTVLSGYKANPYIVNRIAKVDAPEFLRSNARKGLAYYEDGRGGSGLTRKTIREASEIAGGFVSEDKVIRMNAWFKRHLGDLNSPRNSDRNNEDFPGPGAVAWYLWGGSPTNPEQAMNWAERTAERIRENEYSNSQGVLQ